MKIGYVEAVDFWNGNAGLVDDLDNSTNFAALNSTSCSLCGRDYLVGQEIDVFSGNHTDCDYGDAYDEYDLLVSEYID